MKDKFLVAFKKFFSQEGNLFRSSLGFSFLLTLFPVLIYVVIFLQRGILNYDTTTAFIYQYLPESLIRPFIDYIMENNYNSIGALIVTTVATCLLASKSFYSFLLISAGNEDFKTYSIVIRIKAIILFVAFILGIGLIATCGHYFIPSRTIGLGAGMIIFFYFFYRMISFEKRPWRYGIVGAIFSTIAITLVGYLFLYLVGEFTRYGSVYGPLSSMLVLLLSVYFISSIVYFGYCLALSFGGTLRPRKIKLHFIYLYIEKKVDFVKKMVSTDK